MKSLRFLFVTMIITFNFALAAGWQMGGGNPTRNAQALQMGPAGPDVAWDVATYAWFGNQVFTNGDYVVTRRYYAPYNVPIECRDLTTGALLWDVNLPGAFQSLPLGCQEGKVYALAYNESADNTLYALDIANGWVEWDVLAPDLYYFYSPETACFAPNGNLLLGDLYNVTCYDKTNGSEVWNFSRVGMASGCAEVIVSGETVYAWTQSGGNFQIVAIDVDTGQERYRVDIPGEAGGPMQQAAPGCVGPDGTIYVHREGDNITALEDTGNSLNILWQYNLTGSAPFSYIAVGQDGSVYAPIDHAVVRLDPATGTALNTSEVICSGTNTKTRFAIGLDGTVYVSDGEMDGGQLWAFTPDLQTLWVDDVHDINDSGPALAYNGTLVVATDASLRAYRTIPQIEITLTPFNPPVTIPAAGGSFDFTVGVENTGLTPATFDAWVETRLPDGSWLGPLLGPVNLTLSGGFSMARDRTQTVPGFAPEGQYWYAGFVGTYPDAVDYGYAFTFEKEGTLDNASYADWFNDGDEFGEADVHISGMPVTFKLHGAYPNPFNPSTVISFELPEAGFTTLAVYDASGREIARLVDGWREGGMHEVTFDGKGFASGVYIYRLTAGEHSASGRIVLTK